MTAPQKYVPGAAHGASIRKQEGPTWTLVLVRTLRQSPEKVWDAITDPEQLREWAPFDADKSLANTGARVKLTTVGAPSEYATSETIVKRAERPVLLEYSWGGGDMRWELEAAGKGTRLTLWANIDRRYIAMGAAGWHVCFEILDFHLDGNPIGRTVGPAVMKLEGWPELHAQYARQFKQEAADSDSTNPEE